MQPKANMATKKKQPLSTILHATLSDEMQELGDLKPDAVLSVQDQVRIMSQRKNLAGARNDPRFPDVWVKGDNTVVAVRDMSRDHMCMTIGLWLQKEFKAHEQEQLGFATPKDGSIPRVSAYSTPEVWLSASKSFQTTPSLKTMLTRIQGMEGGMEYLHEIMQDRAAKGLEMAQAFPEQALFDRPAFF